jgi:hypothetical protein
MQHYAAVHQHQKAVAAIIAPKPTKVTTSKTIICSGESWLLPTERLILLVEYIWLACTYVDQGDVS